MAGFSTQLSAVKTKHDAYTTNVQKGTYAQQEDYGSNDGYGVPAQFAGRTTTGLELTLGFRYSNDEKKARRTYD